MIINTVVIITTLTFGIFDIFLRKFQSIISVPTLTKIAPNTAKGIWDANLPPTKTIMRRRMACKEPDIGVKPPALTFAIVRIVVPAPGKPPNND